MTRASDDLAKLLHAYRFDQRMPLRELSRTMTTHIDAYNNKNGTDLRAFSIRSLSIHFTKHLNSSLQVQYQMQHKLRQTSAPSSAGVREASASPLVMGQIEDRVIRAVSTFDEMTDLFNKLKGKFDKYDEEHPKLGPLSIHLDIMREMRSTLLELNRMKQSKELIRIAIRSVIDNFMNRVVLDTGKALEAFEGQLDRTRKLDPHMKQLVFGLRKEIVESFISSARLALDQVRHEFALDDKVKVA